MVQTEDASNGLAKRLQTAIITVIFIDQQQQLFPRSWPHFLRTTIFVESPKNAEFLELDLSNLFSALDCTSAAIIIKFQDRGRCAVNFIHHRSNLCPYPNDTSICSAVSAELTIVTNRHAHRTRYT